MKYHNNNFRKIPGYIAIELEKINSRYITVGTVKVVRPDDRWTPLPENFIPEKSTGHYSKWNVEGKEIVRRDLPKEWRSTSWLAPNFGDYSKGTHIQTFTYQAYPRDYIPPRGWAIRTEPVKSEDNVQTILITVDTILDRESQAFEDDLLFAINLMQEKFHDCHVYDVNAKPEDYLKINHIDWEIFPAGSVDRVVSILVEKTRDMTPQKKDQIQDRAEFFNSLNPEQGIIKGSSMGSHYLGAKFSDTLVAFENIDYGNAIYILFDNWEDLSKMSRTEILQRPQKDYIRIPHKGLWKGRVRYEISQRRK